MSMVDNNTIRLNVKAGSYTEVQIASGSTAYPGNLLALTTDGSFRLSAAGDLNVVVALENSLAGAHFEDPYIEGNCTRCVRPVSGDEILVRAAAASYTCGDYVALGANGTVAAAGADAVKYAQVLETVTTTATQPFIGVQIV